MRIHVFVLTLAIITSLPLRSQEIERITFDGKDSSNGYYLAIRPMSKQIRGVVVLLSSFMPPEGLLPETKLHNVAYVNDILTVVVYMNQKLYADSTAVHRINNILTHVVATFAADTSAFVLGGYDEAGSIALRYTELTYEHPSRFPVQPKAVFGVDTPVDLFGFWHWCERQIKKNYWAGSVGDAKYYLDTMTRELGTIYSHPEVYKRLSPFYKDSDTIGNEQYLKSVAVRLYYDTDIEWHLKNRRNSLYDTKMPDASELVNRLLLLGNQEAAFLASKQPGVRSNGNRHPNAISIVDEVECIQWIKKTLKIFDPNTWTPPYHLIIPDGWTVEHFPLPPDFAPGMRFKGVEDLRFAPGWDNSKSDGYWSYAYLWWLNGKPKVDQRSLEENLTAYYSGLVGRNITLRQIPANKIVPTVVNLRKVKTSVNDTATFNGEIRMLDYMAQEPIVLHTRIHLKNCALENRTVVFIEVSPKPFAHAVWQAFSKIGQGFQCDQKKP